MTSVICCTLVVAIAVPVARQAHSAPATDAPSAAPVESGCYDLLRSIPIEPPLPPIVREMCRRSPTFRRQLARLGTQPALKVTVSVWRAPGGDRVRAVTHFRRAHDGVQAAAVHVRVDQLDRVVEHVAHEFEHIMEQLDGIDVGRWVGRSGVYRVETRGVPAAVETARARYVGRMVAAEYTADAATMTAADHQR